MNQGQNSNQHHGAQRIEGRAAAGGHEQAQQCADPAGQGEPLVIGPRLGGDGDVHLFRGERAAEGVDDRSQCGRGRTPLDPRRIERAAREICGSADPRVVGSLSAASKNETCYEQAVEGAMSQLGAGTLAAN